MSNWLDLSGTSNLFKQIYVKGFVDISGGDFISRNGNLIISDNASIGGNLTVTKDMNVLGRFAVQQYSNQNIINTTTTNYTFILAEDMSLNGRLFVNNGIYTNSLNNITAETLGYLDVTSSIQTQLNNIPSLSSILSNNNTWSGSNIFNNDVSLNNRLFVGNGITTKSLNGITSTTLGYVDPTSSIQTQINNKTTLSAVQSNNNNWTGSNKFNNDVSMNSRLFVTNIINNNISQLLTVLNIPDFSLPIDLDCNYNSVFFIDSPTSNFTCNFINLQAEPGKIFTVVLVINIGSSNHYYCNSAQINDDPYSLLSNNGINNFDLGSGSLAIQNLSFINIYDSPAYIVTDVASYL